MLFHHYDTAIRGLGMADERAEKCMTRVICERLRLLASLLVEIGFMPLGGNYLPRDTRQQLERGDSLGGQWL